MATIAEQLEALRAIRARGVLKTRQDGIGEVTYRSDAELAAAIADLERQQAAADSSTSATAGTPIVFGGGKGVF